MNIKRILAIFISILIIGGTVYYREVAVNFLVNYLNGTPKVVLNEKNKYYKDYDFKYVQNIDEFIPYSFQDILNIFYTAINSGYDKFTFYCPNEYSQCLDDILEISDSANPEILTNIGNFVAPFNSFSSINVSSNQKNEIIVEIAHVYNEEEITKVNQKIDEIWKKIVTSDMKDKDIIYAFHDYIINHTKYDDKFEEELNNNSLTHLHDSNKAIGPLYEGYGICSGYTDVMAIILDRLNIPNYKIASSNHVWNLAYIDGKWLHLDATWDDPVSQNRDIDTIFHKFYLIDSQTLAKFDIENHDFDPSIYIEAK